MEITSSSSPVVVVAGTLSDDCAVHLDGKAWATLERSADSPDMLITKVEIFYSQASSNVIKTTIKASPAGVKAEHLYTTVDGGKQWHEVKNNFDDLLNEISLGACLVTTPPSS